MDKRFDVIIMGSGAGGGTLARCLAHSQHSDSRTRRGYDVWTQFWRPGDFWNSSTGKALIETLAGFAVAVTMVYGSRRRGRVDKGGRCAFNPVPALRPLERW
jgi:2-polyprenyl-6-methoxyphenol hydroxylase-like FAD-dependent oxidoreductase